MNKRGESRIGLILMEMDRLNTSISIAKGMLATLSLEQQSLWIKKYQRTDQEHLRILLLEAMEEIWKADTSLTNLQKILSTNSQGLYFH